MSSVGFEEHTFIYLGVELGDVWPPSRTTRILISGSEERYRRRILGQRAKRVKVFGLEKRSGLSLQEDARSQRSCRKIGTERPCPFTVSCAEFVQVMDFRARRGRQWRLTMHQGRVTIGKACSVSRAVPHVFKA